MAKSKSSSSGAMAPAMSHIPGETVSPETDDEYGQRFLNDMDRSVWTGNHPPTKPGPRAIDHRLSTAERAPHIYKDAK